MGLVFIKLGVISFFLGATAEFSQTHLEWLRSQLDKVSDERQAPALWQLWERRYFIPFEEYEVLRRTLRNVLLSSSPPMRLLAFTFLSQMDKDAENKSPLPGVFRRVWLAGPWRQDEGPINQGNNLLSSKEGKVVFPARPQDWRLLPPSGSDGLQELHHFLPTVEQASVWVLAVAEVPATAEALLAVGCAEGCAMWLNGTLIFEDDGLHAHVFQQHLSLVKLHRGKLVILARIYAESPQWQFSLMVCGKDGREVAYQKTSTEQPPREIFYGKWSPVKIIQRDLSLSDWFSRHYAQSADLTGKAVYAYVLSRTQTSDRRQHLLETLLYQAREDANREGTDGRTLVLLAEASPKPELAMDFLEKALFDPIWGMESRAMLGEQLLLSGRVLEALENFREAASANERARVGLVEALEQAGLEGKALATAERFFRQQPTPAMGLKLASLRYALGWTQTARETFLELVRIGPDEDQILRNLMELEATCCGLEKALAWEDKLIALHPQRLDLRLERGRLLMANGRLQEAASDFEEVARLRPFDGQIRIQLARIWYALGRLDKAELFLSEAKRLSPQDPQVLPFRHFLWEDEEEKFYAPWKLHPRQALAFSSPLTGTDTEVLYQLTVVRWRENYAVDQFNQRIYRVKTQAAAEQLRRQEIVYVPDRQRLIIESAGLLRREEIVDGGLLQEEASLSEPWAGMFFDQHRRTVTFNALRPGDLLEISWLIEDTGERTRPEGYFAHLQPMNEVYPVFISKTVLIAPDGRNVFVRAPDYCREENSSDGKQQVWVWECRPRMPISFEPGTPIYAYDQDWLYISNFNNWEDLAGWYRKRISDMITPGQQVRLIAAELTEGLRQLPERVRALYRYVADEIRYLAVEYGRHGVIPASADEVLQRGFGDCKDKSTLLVALLNAAGVEALPVLVKSGWGQDLPRGVAALEFFDHALVYIPSLDWWLDPSVRYFSPNQLPAELQGIAALPIGPDRREPLFTPLAEPVDNRYRVRMKIKPAADGNARVWFYADVGGALAPYMRQRLMTSSAGNKAVEEFLSGLFGQVELLQSRMEYIEEFDRPLSIEAEMNLPAAVKPQSDGKMCIPALGRNTYYQTTFARLPWRQNDLALGPGWRVEWQVEMDLTPNFVADVQPGGTLTDNFVTTAVEVKQKDGSVAVAATFELRGGTIKSSDYPSFRRSLEKADKLLSGFVCMKRREGGEGQ